MVVREDSFSKPWQDQWALPDNAGLNPIHPDILSELFLLCHTSLVYLMCENILEATSVKDVQNKSWSVIV